MDLLIILRLPYLFLPVHIQITTAMLASRKPSSITRALEVDFFFETIKFHLE